MGASRAGSDLRLRDGIARFGSPRPSGLLLCTAGVVLGWWVWNVVQVRTTNAYVVGNITPVSSDVGGQVVALYADDNMIVAAGAPLAQLDPVPFQLEVDRLLADLRNAQAEVRAAAVNVG